MTAFDIPFLETVKLQEKAEEIRLRYFADQMTIDHLPVNCELLAERMGLKIEPYENLKSVAGIDATVIYHKRLIVVDEDLYWNERLWSRLRFTLAHEIAHYVTAMLCFKQILWM